MRPTTRPVANATSPSRGEEVRLLEIREVLPGRHLLTLAAPAIARRVQPGQFVHVLAPPTGRPAAAGSAGGGLRSGKRTASGCSLPATRVA